MRSLNNKLEQAILNSVKDKDIESLKLIFKYTEEQIELMLENRNNSEIIINLYWLFKSKKLTTDRCKKIISILKNKHTIFNCNKFWQLFVNENLINSEYYDYIIEIIAENFEKMNLDCFNILSITMCNTDLLKSKYYKYIIEKAIKIKNHEKLSYFTELAKDLVIFYESTLAPYHIQYVLDVLIAKDITFLSALKDYGKLFTSLQPEDSYSLFTLLSEIDDSEIFKQVCEILISLESNNFDYLKNISLYIKSNDANTLKDLSMLINYSKSSKRSPYFKTNIQDNIQELIAICEGMIIFKTEDKEKVYREITKILNSSLETIVGFTLNEFRFELEEYTKEIEKIKTKLLKPAEKRMKKFII